ncbi:MAG: hypothetical protein GY922_02165 [Proteobacteria bacterium]|nr:hypothetical protein [Pseudomonadota bacterium]
MRVLVASFFIISTFTLSAVSAHQWDVSVPKLQERMMLATTTLVKTATSPMQSLAINV